MDYLCGALPTRSSLIELFYCKKKALRIITYADFCAHTKPIMKETKILSLADQRHHMVSALMWDLDHNTLPPTLSSYFNKHGDLHNQNTRLAHRGKFKVNKTNTVKYGGKSFQVQGSVTLNKLKDLAIYKNAKKQRIISFQSQNISS